MADLHTLTAPLRFETTPQKLYFIFRCGAIVIRVRTTCAARGAEIEIMHPRETPVVRTLDGPAVVTGKTIIRLGDAK